MSDFMAFSVFCQAGDLWRFQADLGFSREALKCGETLNPQTLNSGGLCSKFWEVGGGAVFLAWTRFLEATR